MNTTAFINNLHPACVAGYIIITLFQIVCRLCQWKNFENWSITGLDKSFWHVFYGHSVEDTSNYGLQSQCGTMHLILSSQRPHTVWQQNSNLRYSLNLLATDNSQILYKKLKTGYVIWWMTWIEKLGGKIKLKKTKNVLNWAGKRHGSTAT